MNDLPVFEWLPKPFGPGDTDGTGAQRLLGQPDLTLPELLVRETAQNSWDAALPGQIPEFQMRYRILDSEVRRVLREHVFTRVGRESTLARSLDRDVLDAVEIVDRGTKGLGGPTRNDIASPPGVPTDYADFVLTIGAPPDNAGGGGTYGYGKTASYMASECSTIIIWSRARNAEGGIDERFIASAMEATFEDESGRKFTGRQWWGLSSRPVDDGDSFVVEPVAGIGARKLGLAVFEREFEGSETGTSLLILAPRDDADEGAAEDTLVESWASAIDRNLWPKMIDGQDHERSMNISLVDRGETVPIARGGDREALAARNACLLAIRAAQLGATPESAPARMVEIREIRNEKRKLALGHLAIQRLWGPEPDAGDPSWVNAVTYMRHRAELVVKADSIRNSIGDGRWVGVFKPTQETDDAFALSEPPAHDSWNPDSVLDKRSRSVVSLSLRRMSEATREILRPAPQAASAESQLGTGRVSAALGDLLATIGGSRPLPGGAKPSPPGRRKVGARTTRLGVDILSVVPQMQSDVEIHSGRQRTRVLVKNPGTTAVVVEPRSLAIAVDAAQGVDADEVRLEGWVRDSEPVHDHALELPSGASAYADISYPMGVAIQFNFDARRPE